MLNCFAWMTLFILAYKRNFINTYNNLSHLKVDYEATGRCYHRVMDVGLEFIHTHGTVNLMIASHNIDSIKYAISRMDSLNIQRDSGEVFFGQLLGMCDQGKWATNL